MSTEEDNRPSYSAAQRWSSAFNVAVGIASFLAIVLMLNYLAVRHPFRTHWAGSSAQPLSSFTYRVLESLTNQVRVTVFFDQSDPLYNSVSKLIDEYRLASQKLVIETVDPDKDPSGSEAVRERFKLTWKADNNVIIFQCNDKVEIVYGSRLSEYAMGAKVTEEGATHKLKRTAFKGEMLFTSAIVAATDPHPYRVYFVLNEERIAGTTSTTSSDFGYEYFNRYLWDNRIESRAVDLQRGEVPENCNALIIAGVRRRFFPQELERIDRYLSKGGRALILLPHNARTGLEEYLAKWGVAVGDDQVFDLPNSVTGGADFKLQNYGPHPVVRPLDQVGQPLHLFMVRSVGRLATASQSADAAKVEEIAFTSESGVAHQLRDGVARPGARDVRGKIPVMVAVEKGGLKDVTLDRGATRLVVTGDSLFLANKMFESGVNSAFGWCSTQWLLDRGRLTNDIGPKPVQEYVLRMSKMQIVSVRWIMLGALPGAVLLIGLLVWFRRRH